MVNINQKNQVFPVILEEDETGGYVVINPSLAGCYSQGDTIEEALANIKEATELCLEDAKSNKDQIRIKDVSLHLISLKNNYA
jgi:predicted RNase H-like HicB family nuclease